MRKSTKDQSETFDAQGWNQFFDGPIEREIVKTPELVKPRQKPSYCASWVNDQSFEINRADDPAQSEVIIPPNIGISPLSETVFCHEDQAKKLKTSKTARKSGKQIVEEPPEKRQKDGPETKTSESCIKQVNFFESIARATQEIRKSTNGQSKWKVYKGIYVENDSDNSQTTEETAKPKTPYDDLMRVFREDVKINDGVSFEFDYSFDWDYFSKHGMQYVVFTKVCQSHQLGFFVEMRKEDTKCIECGGSDLAMTIRLTIPLSLSEIAIPAHENLGIHVAFLPTKLPNYEKLTLEIGKSDFSRETAERMYRLYRKMVVAGKPSDEYKEWFERCKRFAKKSLFSKRLRLFHGRVIRRKFEEIESFTKRRCFVFADIFDFDSD